MLLSPLIRFFLPDAYDAFAALMLRRFSFADFFFDFLISGATTCLPPFLLPRCFAAYDIFRAYSRRLPPRAARRARHARGVVAASAMLDAPAERCAYLRASEMFDFALRAMASAIRALRFLLPRQPLLRTRQRVCLRRARLNYLRCSHDIDIIIINIDDEITLMLLL